MVYLRGLYRGYATGVRVTRAQANWLVKNRYCQWYLRTSNRTIDMVCGRSLTDTMMANMTADLLGQKRVQIRRAKPKPKTRRRR